MRSLPSLVLGAALSAVVALATILLVAAPVARNLDAPASEFSALRALVHVRAVAAAPHPVGSAAHEEVRAYVLRTAAALGLDVRVEESTAALRVAGTVRGARIANVIATLPGTRGSGPAVLLAAHYDSVPQSRGASDDGAGVATLLETARALIVGQPLENDVVFLFSDAEELASLGAFAFTQEELPSHPIGVALNFDARGTGGPVAMYDVSANDGALIRALAAAVPHHVSTSLLGALAHALPNDSDATVFMRAGIPTYALAYVDRLYQYHQYTDSTEALDPRSLQHDGDYALPLVRQLGNLPLPLRAEPDVAYFDVFGGPLVVYPARVALGLAAFTLVALASVVGRSRRASLVTWRGVASGSAVALLAIAAATAAASIPHLLLPLLGDRFVLFARPASACGASVLLGAGALLGVYARALREGCRIRAAEVTLGAMSLWGAILAVIAALAPAASFAIQWPLLFSLLGTAYWLPRQGDRRGRVDLSVSAPLVVAAFFFGNLAYTFFVMVGAVAPEVVAAAAALALLLAIPALCRLRSVERSGLYRVVIGAGVVATGGAALASRLATSIPRPDSLDYTLYPGAKEAAWYTNDRIVDSYVGQRIGPRESSVPAPTYGLTSPEITSREEGDGDRRRITLDFTIPPETRCVRAWDDGGERILGASIEGKPVTDLVRFSPQTDEKLMKLVTGDHTPSRWTMEYCGARRTLRVDLLAGRGNTPVKIAGYYVRDGLPGAPLTPRGPGTYPAQDSDATYLSFGLAR